MVCMHVVLFLFVVECCVIHILSIFLAPTPLPSIHFYPISLFHFQFLGFYSYSPGAGDGALTAIGAPPSNPRGSGDSVRSSATCGRGTGNSDSGGRTPPRRRRGVARGLLRASVGGGGGSARSALLGSQERNVRWSRGASVCCCEYATEVGTGRGAGLDRVPAPVAVLVLAPVARPGLESVLVLVLSWRGLQGSSGRREGKKRRGGMPIAFRGGNGDVVVVCVVAESSISVSPAVTLLLPSRPVDRRRDVKSVKSTVRVRAGTRRMDGWRVRGGADGAADGGGGGPQASGEASRRVPQLSRRVERST